MKKIILLFMALILFGCSNDNASNDDINVNVAKLVKVLEVDNNNNETATTILAYNGNNIAATTTTDFEGVFKTKYIYENGKIVKLERYTNDIRKTNEDLSITYEGELINTTYGYDGSNTLFTSKYTYNSKGQMILKKQYDNDIFQSETAYNYDSNGNISTYLNNGHIINYTYDSKKNPVFHAFPDAFIKINGLSKNNLLSDGDSSYSYIYNDKGQPTQKTETHKYMSKTIVTNYYYE